MFKPRRVMTDVCDFTQIKKRVGENGKEVFQRDGNTVERYVSENGFAVEKVTEPRGRHWYAFVPKELVE